MTYFRRLFIASLIAVAGCGPASDHANPADLDAYLTQFANELCKLDVACGSMPDMTTCLATIELDSTEFVTVRADIASGKVRFDSAAGGACLDYVRRIYGGPCTISAHAAVGTAGDADCAKVVVGSVADGGACFSSSECTSTNCVLADTACSRSRACCAGTCAAKPAPIPIGGDCSAPLPGQGCAAGSVCNAAGSSSGQTCQVRSGAQGAPCTTVLDCAAPLFCAADSAAGSRTCQPPAATGAPCNISESFGACDDLNDYCDGTTARCTRRVAPGASCDPDAQNCVGYASCLGGTCVALSTERGACDPTNGPTCLGDLECSATTFTCGVPDYVTTACN